MKVQRDRFFDKAIGEKTETHHVAVTVIMSTDRTETSAMLNALPAAKASQIDEIVTRALDAIVDVLDDTPRPFFDRRKGMPISLSHIVGPGATFGV
jgi:hypothetical protein